MKKSFSILLFLLCCTMSAMAVPAKPGWVTVTQSDGTTLRVQTVGNAFNHAILTSDGLTVQRGDDGDFYYTSSVTGLTTVRAHDADKRTALETAFINAQRGSLSMTIRPYKMPRYNGRLTVGGSNAESGVPALGVRRIPIILVEFADKKFNNTRQDIIDAMLTGSESVGQYFRDQSNGLYEPEFEVHGIYCLSQNRTYYGGHSGSDNDKNLGAMVTEACQLAAADGVSFSPYDTNNDDYCDVVIVIYAGVGEAQASTTHPEAIWPCNWTLDAAKYYSQGGNGAFRPGNGDPLVNTFAVFNELHGSDDNATTIDGIGTFAHEFGHCLGLPDFYDTGGNNRYGMGRWDIMCLGCYNNDGFTPPGYTAYEKVFMGWTEYITPLPGTYYTLPVWNQKSAATDKAVCITSDINENEYFIIENRKKQGWDRYMPTQGIMITHVTYDANRWWANTPNNESIQLMTLVNADDSWSYNDETTDLWPQGTNNAFTDSSTPSAKLNMTASGSITGNAGYLGKPVTEMVINDDGTASFWYMKDAATGPVISVTSTDLDCGDVMVGKSGQLTFKVMGQALTGDVSLALDDAGGAFAIDPTVISTIDAANGMLVTVTFAPTAITDYQATVTLSSEGAQDVVVNLTGHGMIEGYAPVMLPADSMFINLTQFRADWTDATPVDNVASYTLEVTPKPSYELLEAADFSTLPDVLNGNYLENVASQYDQYLPQGWTATSPMYVYGGHVISKASIRTRSYDFTGYDKLTVVIKAASYYSSSYGTATIQVSTGKDSETISLSDTYQDYTFVLDCDASDMVTIQSMDNYMSISAVQVYAGSQPATMLKATEQGDSTYRLITGINGCSYLVKDLLAGGSFRYRVKTVFADGTESQWSNMESVTLFENGHGYEVGDVNHDGYVDVADVSDIIEFILGKSDNCCRICANVNQDEAGNVDVADVSALIDKILGK